MITLSPFREFDLSDNLGPNPTQFFMSSAVKLWAPVVPGSFRANRP